MPVFFNRAIQYLKGRIAGVAACAALSLSVPAGASNLVLTTPTTFSSLDGSVNDDDGMTDGTLTVDNLILTGSGSITNDDPNTPSGASAGPIRIVVTNSFTMDAGTEITAENRVGSGSGGDITLLVGANVSLAGTNDPTPGALISSRKKAGGPTTGTSGDITLECPNISAGSGSTITAGQNTTTDLGSGGAIKITGSVIDLSGEVSSRSGMPALWGAQPPGGGTITVDSSLTLSVGDTGVISSRGLDAGADLVHLAAPILFVGGLVESTGPGFAIPNCPKNHLGPPNRPDKPANSTGGVEVWADFLTIDGAVTHGEINADTGSDCGTAGKSWIDLYARTHLEIFGSLSGTFTVHANGLGSSFDEGGTITVKCEAGDVFGSSLVLQADSTTPCSNGGKITVESNTDLNLVGASLYARGDFTGAFGCGGRIALRSFNGMLDWSLGVGDVRPTGSFVPASQRGTITLTYSMLILTLGTTFPANGLPTTPGPPTQATGGSPTLPGYVVIPTL